MWERCAACKVLNIRRFGRIFLTIILISVYYLFGASANLFVFFAMIFEGIPESSEYTEVCKTRFYLSTAFILNLSILRVVICVVHHIFFAESCCLHHCRQNKNRSSKIHYWSYLFEITKDEITRNWKFSDTFNAVWSEFIHLQHGCYECEAVRKSLFLH